MNKLFIILFITFILGCGSTKKVAECGCECGPDGCICECGENCECDSFCDCKDNCGNCAQ